MTIETDIIDDLTAEPSNPKVRRDKLGRYRIRDTEGKVRSYTRATTVAKSIDDTSNLERWSMRMVLIGLAQRKDLNALAQTIDLTDKDEVQDLADRAKEAGGATTRRDLGTALHAALERSWFDPSYEPPEMFAEDVAAVHAKLKEAGLMVVENMVERVVVDDVRRIAGTFDNLLAEVADPAHRYMADVKTGASMDYGGLGFATQLATYRWADALYEFGALDDGTEDQRLPMPEGMDDKWGIIIHVEPGSGKCELYWLDIAKGREALEVCMAVREMRRAKPLTPWTPLESSAAAPPAVAEEASGEGEAPSVGADDVAPSLDAAALHEAITGANATPMEYASARLDEVKALSKAAFTDIGRQWPEGIPKRGRIPKGGEWTEEQVAEVLTVVARVSATHGLPFTEVLAVGEAPPPTEDTPRPTVALVPELPPKVTDEGEEVTDEDVDALKARVGGLDPEARAWLLGHAKAAKDAGYAFDLKSLPSARRFTLLVALSTLAEYVCDDDLLRAAVTVASHRAPHPSLGADLGSLDCMQAEEFLTITLAIIGGKVTLSFEADGTPSLRGYPPADSADDTKESS